MNPHAQAARSRSISRPPLLGHRRRIARALWIRLVLFAVLAAACFAPIGAGPLVFIVLVPYLDAVRLVEEASARDRGAGRRGALALYLGGALFALLLLHWLVFVPAEEVTVPGLMFPATLLAALYLGLYPFLAQALARRAGRLGVPLWLGLPIAWVGFEYLRTGTELGCPWGLLGYALTSTPVLLQTAALVGVFGVSLIVALVNGLVYLAWREPAHRRRAALLALAVVGGLWGYGEWEMTIDWKPPAGELAVAIVQGDIDRTIKFKPELRQANIARLIDLSKLALAPAPAAGADDRLEVVGDVGGPPALVVWPETAAPCYLRYEESCRRMIERFVDTSDVPLFTGFPDIELGPGGERQVWNAAALFLPGKGLVDEYAKVHLVPFGEAIPYQERLAFLLRLDFGEADFAHGPGFEPLRFPAGDFGAMICFESVFPDAGVIAARRGATFFVNITNDEWFGRSAGPAQHAAMAVVRAIECRRGLVRSANTGISFVVDRYGRRHGDTPLFVPRALLAKVEQGSGDTVYMRIGDIVPRVCLIVSLVLGVIGWRRPPVGRGTR